MNQFDGIILEERNSMDLGYTNGVIHRYNGLDVPDKLNIPVISKTNGSLKAIVSGGRGAIVKSKGNWYKLKGVKPRPGKIYRESGEPFGGMSKKSAVRELEANELVNNGFNKYGYNGPLIPLCYIEYDIPFKEGKVSCVISQTLGDTRLVNLIGDNFLNAFENKDESICDFYLSLSEWIGFGDRVLKEQNVSLYRPSCCLGNFTFYKLDNGYGVGPVDLSSSQININRPVNSLIHYLKFFNLKVVFGKDFDKEFDEKYNKAFQGSGTPEPIEKSIIEYFVTQSITI